jgi:hypothetical protein
MTPTGTAGGTVGGIGATLSVTGGTLSVTGGTVGGAGATVGAHVIAAPVIAELTTTVNLLPAAQDIFNVSPELPTSVLVAAETAVVHAS